MGGFQARLDEVPITGFKTKKVRALLAYLAIEKKRPHHRSMLAGLLWPGYMESSARASLRHSLAQLRQLLGEAQNPIPFLIVEGDTLQFNPASDHRLDVDLFRSLVFEERSDLTKIQRLQAAVDLYQGAFLDGFALKDSPEFDTWSGIVGEELKKQQLEALNQLAIAYEHRGELDKAIGITRKQLKLEPSLEEAHRQLMRLLTRSGQRTAALLQYETCQRRLAEDLNIEPSAATKILYDQISAGEVVEVKAEVGGTLMQDDSLLPAQQQVKHNLPPARTSFIGREDQIARVKELLAEHSLVTLTGPGGVGKTRLALQVAGQVLENYSNGVWLVELAGLSDPARVPKTVASALNLPEIPGKSVNDALVDFLVRKQLLLILDNCEHLLEACTRLADRLLNGCPKLTILASSREFLGVRGEMPYRVPPLAFPDLGHKLLLSQLSEYDSVRLFVERAQVVAPNFAATVDNAAAIVQVVCCLDGIPLAIELAASRMRLLSVEQIAQRLDDAFRLLTGGSRGALPRHQTLRASIDWSYNLLSEPERVLLRRLSVFAGGWRLQAAEQVCADPSETQNAIQEGNVLELLSGLVDKSFVAPIRTRSGRNRFQMLETVRQYAHEKLFESGEAQAMRDRHLGYYLELVEQQAPKIRGPEQLQRLDQFERELDNLRLAMEWGLQRDIEAELKISAALLWFWHIRSKESEGIEWLSRGLGMDGDVPIDLRAEGSGTAINPLVHARAMLALGFFRWLQFIGFADIDYAPEQAKNLLEGAISIYQGIGPEGDLESQTGIARAQLWLGYYIVNAGGEPDQAVDLAQRALETFRASGDWVGLAEGLQLLGICSSDPAEAKLFFQEQLAIHEAEQDSHGMGSASWYIGCAAVANGEYETAGQAFEASLFHTLKYNELGGTAIILYALGVVHQTSADLGQADKYIEQSLASAYEDGIDLNIVHCLQAKSEFCMAQGNFEQAAKLNQEALSIAQRTDIQPILATALVPVIRLARLQGDTALAQVHIQTLLNLSKIRPDQKTMLFLESGHLALGQGDLVETGSLFLEAIQELLCSIMWFRHVAPMFDGVALLALKKGEMASAARLFGNRWCRGYAHFLSPIEKEWRQPDWDAMQTALGDDQFERIYESGRSMTFKDTVDLAMEIVSQDRK
jgi:predicted ATPase/DNA-binding SARP family transcriptional activator